MVQQETQNRCHVCERQATTVAVSAARITKATVRGFIPIQVGAHSRVARTVDFNPSLRAVWKFLVHRNDKAQWKTCGTCLGELRGFEVALHSSPEWAMVSR